jgi:integrase
MHFVVFPHFFRLIWGKNGENSSSLLGYGVMLNPNELKTETSKLRELGVKVTITQKGGTLYLRCVLPPRPGSIKVKPHRQEVKPLPRGVAANQQGLKIAKKRAIELWGLLQTGAFNWDDWEKKPSVANPQTVREWVEQFCSYWLSRGECSPETWKKHWAPVYSRLPQEARLSYELALTSLLATPQHTRNRKRSASTLQRLLEFAEVEGNLTAFGTGYQVGRSEEQRDPPTDELIMTWRKRITSNPYCWVYGVIACFGLRPHEAFFLEKGDDPRIWQLTNGKTGPRQVSAVYPEWVERWNLLEGRPPKLGPYFREDGQYNFRRYGERVSKAFGRYEIPFHAYDLRHAYALRLMRFPGISDSTAAKLMGHSLAVHNRTYQRWLTARDQKTLYTQGIASGPAAPSEPN